MAITADNLTLDGCEDNRMTNAMSELVKAMESLAQSDFKAGLVNGKIPRDADGAPLMNTADPIPSESLEYIAREYEGMTGDAERAYRTEWCHLVSSTPIE